MQEISIDITHPEQNQKFKQAPENKERKSFFQKIAVILLDNERKTEVASEIIEDSNFGKLYRLQLILSIIICSL